MALSPLYELQFYIDCESVDVVDETVYGAPNADREDVAVYLFVTRKFEDPADDTDLSPANDTPITTTTWNIITADDGHYEFLFIAIDVWDNTVTYNTDELVHHNGSVYKALQDSITPGTNPAATPASWQFVSNIPSESSNASLQYSNTASEIIDCRIRKAHKIELVNDECLCSPCDEYHIPLHTKLFNMLNAAQARALDQQYIEAEKIIRTATEMIEGILDS